MNRLTVAGYGSTLAWQERLRENPTLAVVRRLLSNPKGVAGTAFVCILVFIAVFAPWLAPYDPIEMHTQDQLQLPSAKYWFGADELGRDIMSRIFYGARISLLAGLGAVSIAATVGSICGLAAGYYRGSVDSLLMRVLDTLMSFPAIFLAIGIVAVIGPGYVNAALAVAIINIPGFARLVRAATLGETGKDYVEAARAMGASHTRIMLKTIFPNCFAPLLVAMAINAPSAVLTEAALAFLGLGTQPPDPSWGSMLQASQSYLSRSWSYGIFPGLAITFLAISMNFVGDSLQDALDPRRIRAAAKMT